MFSGGEILIYCCSLIFAYVVLTLICRPYPPGPPSLPILGVALNHPQTEFWRTYADWGRKYGDEGFISFHLLGKRMVILNSASDANNLLSKRSSNYSDRPFPTMAGILMRREKSMFYISHNERFKIYRKMMHHAFNPAASQMYWGIQEHEARILVDSILKTPGELPEHLRRNAAAVIMKIAYGYSVIRNDDHFVALAEEGMRVGSLGGAPGKWLVDSLPFLQFLPNWFPGAGFKIKAKEWSEKLYSQSFEPHNWVKQQIAAGKAAPSFSSRLLQPSDGIPVNAELEDHILWTAGALYSAGADTSVSAVKTFFFAMMLHPSAQARAQDEVDHFLASEHRIPTLHDQAAFPYIGCILKEVLRWAPASPIGLFHCTTRSDIYKGYSIPAKTTVIANIWAMMHDETIYPDPFSFDPTRFEGMTPQPDPREYVFGFGRRVCPGQNLAESSMWIQMVLSLMTVTISKAVDSNGKIIEPEIGFTTAIVSHVKPFKYQITPRSAASISLVRQALQDDI
ncbi:cytochrome P450 [Mycena rosella]|uniref:Cytochrome P450 n=1 Tax=Mycena rosella TaxID=1033263 RepID=A0AAD7DHZ7_MYCRO|nr:cytochrome P450 [Mycena rosella]